MADVSIIKLGTESLNIKDETARNNIGVLSGNIATVSNDLTTAVNGLTADINSVNANLGNEIAVERVRIDNLATLAQGSTTGDAELADIRVGYNGNLYENAGNAVRLQTYHRQTQIDNIWNCFDNKDYNYFDQVFDEYGYIDGSGNNAASANFKRTSGYYEIPAGSTYYYRVHLSVGTPNLKVMFYDQNHVYVNNITMGSTIVDNGKAVAAAKYFRIYCDKAFTGMVYVGRALFVTDHWYNVPTAIKQSLIPAVGSRLIGKNIVNFGDSLFGNAQDSTSISAVLGTLSGANVVNAGFGGCQMTNRSQANWAAFSMCNLAAAVASGDWSAQDTAVADPSWTAMPAYFPTSLATLKAIDWTTVDLITIAFGTNDYTAGVPIADTGAGFDIDTYIGALKYSVRAIQQTYPHIKIAVITPVWRYFNDNTDSDTKDYGQGTLRDYADALVNGSNLLRIPVLNSYNNLSLSVYNATTFMADYTHLNADGRSLYAELIDGYLNTLY